MMTKKVCRFFNHLIFSHIIVVPVFFLLLPFNVYAADIQHINQQELTALQEDENTLLVDVRSVREFQRGHIPNAININYSEIIANPQILKQYEGKNVVLYCHSGSRVKYADKALQQSGLAKNMKLFHLKGDFRGWQGKDKPIESISKR